MDAAETKGSLYVVAIPIGHPDDITHRAIATLQAVDAVICEAYREGSTLLKKLGIAKELLLLNEHNEEEAAQEILAQLRRGRRLAIVSDCGTPVFADPGHYLIRAATQAGIPVTPVPGASALMAALSLCDFKVERFIFEGFLPRERGKRRQHLRRLAGMHLPLVLMDAPYRLVDLLEDVGIVYGKEAWVILACDLTQPSERVFRGAAAAILRQLDRQKAEFVLIVASGSGQPECALDNRDGR